MKATATRPRSLVTAHLRGRALAAGEAAARVRAGLSIDEFEALRALLGFTVQELAGKIGISIATLSRRRQQRLPLDPGHGDRLLRFARLFRLATDLHGGDPQAAREWLRRPARALGGEVPLDHAETEAGAREVEALIGRLEHGVYT